MAIYQDQGVVLRVRPYREADVLATLFLAQQGKVSAVARGVRRPKSALAAGLYPLCYSGFSLYRGRSSLETVTGAEVIHPFARLRDDLDRIGWATLLAEVVDECFSERDPSPEAFYLLVAGLEALADGRHAPTAAMTAIFQLARAAGFLRGFDRCAACGRALDQDMAVDAESAEPLCPACGTLRGGRRIRMEAGALKTLRRWLTLPGDKFGSVELRGRLVRQMVDLLEVTVTAHNRRPPRALEFVGVLVSDEREQTRQKEAGAKMPPRP